MSQKIWGYSKTQVNYRPAKRPATRCDACRFMFPKLPVGACKLVRGTIKASYTCDEFKSSATSEN